MSYSLEVIAQTGVAYRTQTRLRDTNVRTIKMLNEEFLDRKGKEIIRLKMTIAAFKKYDSERKKFIKELQWELEEANQQYLELESSVPKDVIELQREYREKVKKLKAELKRVNEALSRLQQEMKLMKDEEKLKRCEAVVKAYKVVTLKGKNSKLENELKESRKSNNELIMKIIKLEKMAGNEL